MLKVVTSNQPSMPGIRNWEFYEYLRDTHETQLQDDLREQYYDTNDSRNHDSFSDLLLLIDGVVIELMEKYGKPCSKYIFPSQIFLTMYLNYYIVKESIAIKPSHLLSKLPLITARNLMAASHMQLRLRGFHIFLKIASVNFLRVLHHILMAVDTVVGMAVKVTDILLHALTALGILISMAVEIVVRFPGVVGEEMRLVAFHRLLGPR